jgi:protoporphyrinogen oxidase
MGDKKKVIILGGGIAGLAVGYFLSRTNKFSITVLEESSVIGGMCASFQYKGFTLDYGAHKFYSVIPEVLDEIKTLMKDRFIKLPKKNRIYLEGHLLDYPLRLGNLLRVLGIASSLRLGFGYAAALSKGLFDRRQPQSYEEYMIKYFGSSTYKLVFEPLADKVWGDPSGLHPEMAQTRVPSSGGLDVILKLVGLRKDTANTNADFFYYPRLGFGELTKILKEQIEAMGGKIFCNAKITGIAKTNNKIFSVSTSIDGNTGVFPCDYLISSIPLPILSRIIFHNNEQGATRIAETLQFRHLILVYIFVKRPLALKDQWIFFPEREYIFNRIFEQKQMNLELGPNNQTVICCDFTCTRDGWKWKANDKELADKCIEGLAKIGFIKIHEVDSYLVKRVPNFYPRYDLNYTQKIDIVFEKFKEVENLLLTGRIGMYNYNNCDHCIDMAMRITDELLVGRSSAEIIDTLRQRVKNYRIVD